MRWRALLLVGLVACRRTPAPAQPDSSPTKDASVVLVEAAGSDGGAMVAVPPPPAAPYGELPPLGDDLGFADRSVGFSKDDRYLGYEISTCDPCPSEFHFAGSPLPPLDFNYFYDPTVEDSPNGLARQAKQDADVEKKLAMLGAEKASDAGKLRGPFPYPDLMFAMKTERRPDGSVALLFGAHLPKEPPVFPMRLELGAHPMIRSVLKEREAQLARLSPADRERETHSIIDAFEMHEPSLVYANVTKDGADIGAVAIARGSSWFEAGATSRMSTAAFVGQIYNDTAMRHHQSHEPHEDAADLFAKAEAAAPKSPLFSYNLACSLARKHDPLAEAALGRAIQKGGPSIAARAKKDADFDAVRSEAWFTKLVR